MSQSGFIDVPFVGSKMIDRHYQVLAREVPNYTTYGLDRQGRVTDWNPGSRRINGSPPEDIIGHHFSQLYTPEDQAKGEPQRALSVVASTGRFEGQGWRVRGDGSRFWADVVIENVNDDQGLPIGYVKIQHDMTEYRAEIRALESAMRELEQALDDRTDALAQRDILLQEVYHRVKNNLQAIEVIIGLQASRVENPEAKAALNNLRSRVSALGLVHKQLMGSDDLKTFDIAPFLSELTMNLVNGAATGGVSLSVRSASIVVGLDFAVPMALLITELVTNALKHAFPTGAGRIDVSLDVDPGGALKLVVADNGQGIQPPPIPPEGRTGLGSYLVKNLTKQLKGVMEIESVRGTRVEITLPFREPS